MGDKLTELKREGLPIMHSFHCKNPIFRGTLWLAVTCALAGFSACNNNTQNVDDNIDAGTEYDSDSEDDSETCCSETYSDTATHQEDTETANAQDCIMQYCSQEIAICFGDEQCMEHMDCIIKCASLIDDQDAYNRCTLGCNLIRIPSDPEYDNLMACALDNNCGPQHSDNCATFENEKKLHDISPKELAGFWYNVKGYNPGTDCFDCAYSTFTQGSYSDESRKTSWTIDWLMDDLGMKYIEGEMEVGGPAHPGLAIFTYTLIGVTFVEHYSVVHYENTPGDEVIVLVGCGGSETATGQVGYSIGLVLTRKLRSELSPDLVKRINKSLADVGITPPLEKMDVAQWCSNEYHSCPQ